MASGLYSADATCEPSISKSAKVQSARCRSRSAPCSCAVWKASGTGSARLPALLSANRVAPGPAPTSDTPLRQTVPASRIE
nr:hypothetical protein [Micromonospora sp. S4605]